MGKQMGWDQGSMGRERRLKGDHGLKERERGSKGGVWDERGWN